MLKPPGLQKFLRSLRRLRRRRFELLLQLSEPGKSGPKSKAYQAAGMSYDITSFFTKQSDVATSSSSKAASAAASAAQHEDEDNRALADRIQQNNAEPRLPETYPADWPKLRDVYVGLLAQEQTRQVRDRRREMLSLALGKPEDFQYGLLKKLSDYFAVTSYEATCARLHCLEHGPGMPTPPFSYCRQGCR